MAVEMQSPWVERSLAELGCEVFVTKLDMGYSHVQFDEGELREWLKLPVALDF